MSVKPKNLHCPFSSGGGEDSTERESPQRTDSNRSKPEGKEYTRGRTKENRSVAVASFSTSYTVRKCILHGL